MDDIGINVPVTRMGQYLYFLAHGGDFNTLPEPVTTEDHCWYYICKYGIKTFINGDSDSVWHNGEGDPTATNPADSKIGDYYIDTLTGKYHVKNTETTWNHIGTLQGIAGADGATWLNGEANPPDASEGKEGDYYLNNTSGMYWKKVQNVWQEQGTLKGVNGVAGPQGNPGRDGAPGSKWFNGDALPDVNSVNVRDYFINNTNGDYHEKVGTSWVKQGNLKGPKGDKGDPGQPGSPGTPGQAGTPGKNGTMWHYGTGHPTQLSQEVQNSIPVDDLYIDKTDGKVYKRTSNGWQDIQLTLKGEKGDAGVSGQAGTSTTTVAGTTWHQYNGDPRNNIQHPQGHYCINTTNGDIYISNGTSWTQVAGTVRVNRIINTSSGYGQGGWTDAGNSFENAYYYKKDGIIYLEGAVKHNGAGTPVDGSVIFNLIQGSRPKKKLMFPVVTCNQAHGNSGYGITYISIEPDGNVCYRGGINNNNVKMALSLSGVSFALTSN